VFFVVLLENARKCKHPVSDRASYVEPYLSIWSDSVSVDPYFISIFVLQNIWFWLNSA